jgi:hypothetical protein
MKPLLFPKWINRLRPGIGVALVGGPLYLGGLLYFGGSPRTLNVGYMPEQPVPYSHSLHAGDLGIDCRYCHTTVEKAAVAAIPSTEMCMNCHTNIRATSEKLQLVRESNATGKPVEWLKVHDLPDYVYFDHSAHVTRGVGCVECHGRVDRMEEVFQAERLSMGWCLECHRQPETHLRPVEEVTNMEWIPPDGDRLALGARLREENNINPSTDCSTCHR